MIVRETTRGRVLLVHVCVLSRKHRRAQYAEVARLRQCHGAVAVMICGTQVDLNAVPLADVEAAIQQLYGTSS